MGNDDTPVKDMELEPPGRTVGAMAPDEGAGAIPGAGVLEGDSSDPCGECLVPPPADWGGSGVVEGVDIGVI
jgi:hypothetical protein